MNRDHLMHPALRRLLLGVVTALAVWPAAARADDITVFSATAGVPFDGVVAVVHKVCGGSCTILNPFVTVHWGDGSSTMGVKALLSCDPDPPPPTPHCPSGDYVVSVLGSPHTYARPGAYAVSFGGPIFVPDVSVDGIVGDDPHSIVETLPPLKPVVGATLSGAIATFTDTNLLAQASEFTATINWGDGSTTPATVTQPLGQPFQVSGSHVYAHVGSFPVTVAIQHVPINPSPLGASASTTTTATVSDAALTGAGNIVTAVAGVPFSGTVATFADPNPFAKATDFTATIAWGSEATTPGAVTAAPGGFAVSGTHTFVASGQIPIRVVVGSSGGSMVTVDTAAAVSPAPPPPVSTVALSPAAPDGMHGWYRSVVHASVSARSLIGTVAQTRCRLDGAAPSAFGALPSACPFAGAGADIAGDGRHVLFAASITDAGQAELPGATAVAIDRTPPRLACARAAPTFVQGSIGATVTATVRDATSGPLSQTVAGRAAVATPGQKQARLTGIDQAGNSASIRCGYRVLGQIGSSMSWNFNPGPSFTTVESLTGDDVPVASTVRMRCRGIGCPSARTLEVSVRRACTRRRTCAKPRASATSTVNVAPLFRGRRLGVATVVTVTMSERDEIGKAWAFTMRSGRKPKVVISCLAPGSTVPGRGC
jgi:hypothetical protein